MIFSANLTATVININGDDLRHETEIRIEDGYLEIEGKTAEFNVSDYDVLRFDLAQIKTAIASLEKIQLALDQAKQELTTIPATDPA